MAQKGVLAQRYAEGYLAVVRDTGKLRESARELEAFVSRLETDPRVRNLMENPSFSTAQRLEFLEGLRSGLSDPTYGLLRLVIQKKRIPYLPEILEAYETLYRKELGIVRATVSVAQDTTPEMEAKIKDVVRRISGKEPELKVIKDPSLIGGIKVQMGNTVLDASIRTKLQELHKQLLAPPREAA
jgi:F-type H+-transporting ATPase subunit delta